MADYEPGDLSDIRNVEMIALSDTVVGTPHIDIDELTRPEVTSFRGLPFQFGGGRLISVGDSISIPIGKIASRAAR